MSTASALGTVGVQNFVLQLRFLGSSSIIDSGMASVLKTGAIEPGTGEVPYDSARMFTACPINTL